MSKKSSLKLLLLLPLVALTLSGCSLSVGSNSSTSSKNVSDSGVFKSLNKGTIWTQQTLIQSVSTKKSFAGVDIYNLIFDPTDNKTIYAGSIGNGLFYSYDGAESWQVATGLGKISIDGVAVDPVNKCLIYVASGNKVFKSNDCSRTWTQIYFDNDIKISITSIIINYSSSNNIFIGTSSGNLIKSSDYGASWRVLGRFGDQVEKIVFSPIDSKKMFACTLNQGIFRSSDSGEQWEKLVGNLKDFDGSKRFRDLVIEKSDKEILFLATKYGLLKSTDNGEIWSKIELLTAEEPATINSIAVNHDNTDEIYYVTGTNFYHSLDAGKTWISKKLPTSRKGGQLLIDPKNSAILYLAAWR